MRYGNLRSALQTAPCRTWLFHGQSSRTRPRASLAAQVVTAGVRPEQAPECAHSTRTAHLREIWRAGLWACRRPSSRPNCGPTDLVRLPTTASTILAERSRGKEASQARSPLTYSPGCQVDWRSFYC